MITETAARLRAVAEASPDASGHFAALYCRVTERIAQSIAAGLGGGRVFTFSLRRARRQAWTAAENLRALHDEAARERYRGELDDLAYLVTRPPLALRPLVAAARLREERDPRRVTAALLGGRTS